MDLWENEGYKLLIKAILSLESEKEAELFLDDLMTKKEILDSAQRMLVAKMLSEQIVYNKIVEETGASTATISRVNRSYLYGAGGYKKALDSIAEEKK
jgi:TrpR-related protein YerC/YecD